MSLEDLLGSKKTPKKDEISDEDLHRLFMKHKGLLKERERDKAFWAATNENLKLAYEKLDEKDRELERAYSIIHEDLKVAKQIQDGLHPNLTGQMKSELELEVYHKQLLEVGGDYYDFFKLKGGSYAIGIFDISGHGVSAALVMTYLKSQFIRITDKFQSPKEIVEWVNSTSYSFLKSVKKYATINFVVFNKDKIGYVCGGSFGLLVRGKKSYTFKKGDQFLGLRNKPFHEYELNFTKDNILVLYTDGMIEAQNEKKKDYTVAKLNRIVIDNSEKPVKDILKLCLEDYQNFRNTDSDDITLLIMRKKA